LGGWKNGHEIIELDADAYLLFDDSVLDKHHEEQSLLVDAIAERVQLLGGEAVED
jgi:hypothetical protein